MKRAIAGVVIVASVVSLPALGKPGIEGPTVLEVSRPVEGLTVDDVRELHREFDPGFTVWTGGGPSSRYIYVHPWEFWPQVVLRREGPIQPLPMDPRIEIQELTVSVSSGEWTLADYVDESHVDAVVVLHQGRIVFESYPRMRPDDRHLWFSVSKTVLSTAIAILEDRGQIDVSRPVESYLDALAGTAWEGVPVLDILDMASGIDCPEVKEDPDACFWAFYDAFGWPKTDQSPVDPMESIAQMARKVPSGQVFDYTSVNTELLNALVESVSGERYSDFVEHEIWRRVGAEADAFVISTAHGSAFSAGGVSSTVRDLARYGLLFTPTERSGEDPVVSDAYLSAIQDVGRPELTSEEQRRSHNENLGEEAFLHSTRHWDIVTTDGDLYKGGFGGQGLYVSPSRDLVVAWFGTSERGRLGEMTNVARRLATSGLFDPEETTSASRPKIETGFAEVNGTRLYYEVAGTGDPIVLIHGNFGDRRYYDGQFEALARLHRVLRYDVRGYGKSMLPEEG
jgi:CubicO group peptidase (beta-lactamase class C family)